MNVTEVMRELERLGTDQNRKVYRRHGAGEATFGVSFAHLYTLQKRIKRDHELASELWATGNADARMLAALIADPAGFTREALDAWINDVRYHLVLDLVVKNVAAETTFARELMERWTASPDEYVGRAGWGLAGHLATSTTPLPDAFFEERIATIEVSIHRAPNRTREAMNTALIQIGARNSALRDKAIAAARRIGKVAVDHGDTDGKTPDAAGHIEKLWIQKAQAGKGQAAASSASAERVTASKASSTRATKALPVRAKPPAPARETDSSARRRSQRPKNS